MKAKQTMHGFVTCKVHVVITAINAINLINKN